MREVVAAALYTAGYALVTSGVVWMLLRLGPDLRP